MDQRFVRNFSIIAHIDHGKSTLADRFLELTGALQAREMEAQVLDAMDLERERGITIKAHPVRLNYTALDGQQYVLNLIDTPGHVDFGYEVTRSLAACEGALLLVDASQGVEAQTLANAYLAVDNGLEIIPVINKIDLPSAQPDECKRQIEDIIGLDASTAILASAKDGTGVREILEAVVERFHPPKGDPNAPLKALIFDSWYDAYRGVVIVVRVIDGVLRPKSKVRLMATKQDFEVLELGVFSPKATPVDELGVGEVGFVVANIKVVADAKIGDTVTETQRPTTEPFPGFKELKPMVFAGLYPVESHQYAELREALEKLRLNDASFFYEPETSAAWASASVAASSACCTWRFVQGAAGARVRHGPGDHGARRALSRDDDRWGRARGRQPGEAARSRTHRQARRAGHHRHDPDAVGARRSDSPVMSGQAGGAEEARVPQGRPRAHHL
jgi:GTP-binding protein LepA